MAATPQRNPWIHCQKPRPACRLRLFCFPYAGGGAAVFRNWWQHVPEDVEVCGVQLPGRENRFREPPFRRLEPLVETLAEALEPYGDVPFAYLGHSMGALIAFELARRRRRADESLPLRLFVLGHRGPQLAEPLPPIHHLPELEFVDELQRRYQGVPSEVVRDPELRRLFLPIVRADLEIVDSYVYRTERPLDCPLSVLGGRDDSISREELAAWCDNTNNDQRIHMLPGGHFFLNTETPALLRLVCQDLLDLPWPGPFTGRA